MASFILLDCDVLHPLVGEGGQVGLERLIDAVIVEDAVVSPQIIVAEADWVIVPAHDGEFHLRVCHEVAVLEPVMGDADDLPVSRQSARLFDDDGHIFRIVADSGMAALRLHVRLMVHRFIKALHDEFGTGVEAFHGVFLPCE